MIPLMDVRRQYKNMEQRLDKAALEVLHSGSYIMGEAVKEFEDAFADFIGVKYAIGVANGTDALEIALMAAGIGSGDEVITTAMSFFATAEAIAAVGATPVFVDCTLDTYTIAVNLIEEKITSKTKAILPVHLYGQCADMDEILLLAQKYNLCVIEDVAQATGAEYKGRKAGGLGTIGCFSFFPTKNLGCAGDGGMITTNSEDLYKKCLAYRVHGSGENGLYTYTSRNCEEEDVAVDFHGHLPKYFNFVVGRNSRLDTLQAVLLKEKLSFLDEWNKKRQHYASFYDEKIVNPLIQKVKVGSDRNHVYYVYVVTVEDREKFQTYLKERGIATGVYFPVPMHLQWVFKSLGYQGGDMPNAEYLAEHGVAIPMFPELTKEEIKEVVDAINSYAV